MKKKALTAIAALGIVAAFYGCYKSLQSEEHILNCHLECKRYPENR
jgi:hypothetical protein